jgi:hypothetical protein
MSKKGYNPMSIYSQLVQRPPARPGRRCAEGGMGERAGLLPFCEEGWIPQGRAATPPRGQS